MGIGDKRAGSINKMCTYSVYDFDGTGDADGDSHRCELGCQWTCGRGERIVHIEISVPSPGFRDLSPLSTPPITDTNSITN